MNEVAYEVDLTSGQLRWGKELFTLYGYQPADLVATLDWWTDHIHPEDAMILNQAMDKLLDPYAKGWTVVYRFMKADHNYVLVQDTAEIVRDDEGNPLRLRGVIVSKAA